MLIRSSLSYVIDDRGRMNGNCIPLSFSSLKGEGFKVTVDGARMDGIDIWRTTSETGLRSLPSESADVITIRLPRRGLLVRRDRREEFSTGSGTALLLPFDGMRDMIYLPGLESLNCTVSRDLLLKSRQEFEETDRADLAFEPLVKVDGLAMRAFANVLEALFASAMQGPDAPGIGLPLMSELLVHQLLLCWPRRTSAVLPGKIPSRRLGRAIDFIEAHLRTPLTLAAVARAAGASPSALHRAFREELGTSPVQFILERRLEKVHEELSRDREGRFLSEIAHAWGFRHMGDFSRRYKLRYGQSPSQTRSQDRAFAHPCDKM